MRLFKKALLFLTLIYLVIEAAFLIFQRDLIYLNQHTELIAAPTGLGETVTITSEDGTKLSAWWIAPGPNNLGRVLLYCHGNGATLSQLVHVAKLFHDYGLSALLFDYRGYGASDEAQLTEDAVAADARSAFDWIKSKRGFSDSQIVVWGHSLGAAVASRLATERTPAALITEGAFSSIYEMGRYRYPWLFLNRLMLLDRFEVAQNLSQRGMPLLMMHAENDTIVPIELGKRAFAIAREPKEWLLLKGIDHNDFPSVEGQYREKLLDFISKNVKPRL